MASVTSMSCSLLLVVRVPEPVLNELLQFLHFGVVAAAALQGAGDARLDVGDARLEHSGAALGAHVGVVAICTWELHPRSVLVLVLVIGADETTLAGATGGSANVGVVEFVHVLVVEMAGAAIVAVLAAALTVLAAGPTMLAPLMFTLASLAAVYLPLHWLPLQHLRRLLVDLRQFFGRQRRRVFLLEQPQHYCKAVRAKALEAGVVFGAHASRCQQHETGRLGHHHDNVKGS